MPNPKFYVAGPFFNERQTQVIQQIETMLDDYGYPYFSPRQHGPVLEGRPRSMEDAMKVFDSNVMGLLDVDVLLAVADYLLPEGQELRAVTPVEDDEDDMVSDRVDVFAATSPALHIPDLGTTFELGLAHGIRMKRDAIDNKPEIVLFTERQQIRSINLMLTMCADGTLFSWAQMQAWLEGGLDDKFLTKAEWPV